MSSHGNINTCGSINFDPNLTEDGIQFEICMPDYIWADSEEEAIGWLDEMINSAQKAKKKINGYYKNNR